MLNSILFQLASFVFCNISQPTLLQKQNEISQNFLYQKIEYTLNIADIPYNESFIYLLMGTAAVETDFGIHLNYTGIDRGLFQINKHTEQDIVNRILPKFSNAERCIQYYKEQYPKKFRYLLEYQIILAAVLYQSRINILDLPNILNDRNIWTLAWIWKNKYNTHLGAGKTEHFFQKYNQYIEES